MRLVFSPFGGLCLDFICKLAYLEKLLETRKGHLESEPASKG